MKKYLLICSLVIIGSTVYSQTQPITLKVYQVCKSDRPLESQSIDIKFVVEKDKCDPNIGYISMEDRLYHFEDALKSRNINFSSFKRSITKSFKKENSEVEHFNFTGSEAELDVVIELSNNQGAEISNFRNNYLKMPLEEQDNSAICALEKAVSKAQFIANSLGYKNCKLIAVDDDSSSGGYISSYISSFGSEYTSPSSSYSIIGYFEVY